VVASGKDYRQMTKSSKYRVIARERHEAAKEGRLPDFYAKREAEKAYAQPASNAPDFSVQTLESVSWSEDSRYPRWLLPTQVASPRGRY
jgi:hypothetical protein